MMRFFQLTGIWFLGLCVASLNAHVDSFETVLIDAAAEIDFEDKSWFTDTLSTVLIQIPDVIPEDNQPILKNTSEVVFAGYDIVSQEKNQTTVIHLRWYPTQSGLITFPSLNFVSEGVSYQTIARQIQISEPYESSEMSLAFEIPKTTVYVGEPLRMDVVWHATLSSKRIRSLQCHPSFFNCKDLEIAVRRSTFLEEEELGIPFGGRRILARRQTQSNQLGVVSFALDIRFLKPGLYRLPRTRLECAYLKADHGELAPYAAYYNNGLFEPVDRGLAHHRIYTESDEIQIEVLELPQADKNEFYQGWFRTDAIDVVVNPTTCEVGQILDLDIIIKSSVATPFIPSPDLSSQPGLRSWFKWNQDWSRIWRPDGIQFSTRIRPLTTQIQALPSMTFQVFNPNSASYEWLETSAIPLVIKPSDGKSYFDTKTLRNDKTTLTDQPEGIWHNQRRSRMNEILNAIIGLFADHFLWMMLLGPLMFILLYPWAKRRYRLATDKHFRSQTLAYRQFLSIRNDSPEKWNAFKSWIAIGFRKEPSSWTIGDTREELKRIGVVESDIQKVCEYHAWTNSMDYSGREASEEKPQLEDVAKRIYTMIKRTSLFMFLILLSTPQFTEANEWDQVDEKFKSALMLDVGSLEKQQQMMAVALEYEALIDQGFDKGIVFYNAGNAWFMAGKIGQSIACYQQAMTYRPFDPLVRENLTVARAMSVDVVNHEQKSFFNAIPMRWMRAVLVSLSLIFWVAVLTSVRFRNRYVFITTGAAGFATLAVLVVSVMMAVNRTHTGVVIVPELFARKGPSYQYQPAFLEPIHDGLEFTVNEFQEGWILCQFADGRNAWVPEAQVRLVQQVM